MHHVVSSSWVMLEDSRNMRHVRQHTEVAGILSQHRVLKVCILVVITVHLSLIIADMHWINPLKDRAVNWLHFAIQV